MPRGRLSVAKGPRGSHGLVAVLRFQNLVNDDWVQSWGVLPGPAVVQVAFVPGRDFPVGNTRVTPLAAPPFTGSRSGAQANVTKSSSLVFVDTDGSEARAPSLSNLWGGQVQMRWWPRLRIPWATWSPALWVDPTALGQLWIAYFSLVFEVGVGGAVVRPGGSVAGGFYGVLDPRQLDPGWTTRRAPYSGASRGELTAWLARR